MRGLLLQGQGAVVLLAGEVNSWFIVHEWTFGILVYIDGWISVQISLYGSGV